MLRSRSFFGWNRPKNRLSLEHLKYLYSILEKNTTVSETNRSLLVESLRCIAEILIWGDQHDSSVFDFFLEKNMLSYFLHIMRQKSCGSSFVCQQLLQTLNILFENIRNETSLYYLLSNNHVNSIIVHKFDFSDEDVMGYYILFLKTLSLKLNPHTIHFFYNEHTNDFPLYTEAIKFFNHPESMVRIAVRTISLNVYKVENISMLQFIRDKTAAPYFSNLVWFIGKHILELDNCVRNDIDHQSQQRLSNLVAEHLDHLHYLNDILLLEIADLNAVLTEHLLHKLFVPLYVFSLTPAPPMSIALLTQNLAAVLNKTVDIDMQEMSNPRVSSVVALYLLSLVFLVVNHGPLVHALAWVILNGDQYVFKEGAAEILNAYIECREAVAPGFGAPQESLEEALDTVVGHISVSSESYSEEGATSLLHSKSTGPVERTNITDEEKERLRNLDNSMSADMARPFLDMILSSLDCSENDYLTLLGLCLFYALANNKGVDYEWFDRTLIKSRKGSFTYKTAFVNKLINIALSASQSVCRIRLITLQIALRLLEQLTKPNTDECCITEVQQSSLFAAKDQAMSTLRNYYKSEDMFLDLFEDEYLEFTKTTLNVEFLCDDETILLPPTGTPLTGILFNRRLPCGEVEKARRAIRIFFHLRKICQTFLNEDEILLPLTNVKNCVKMDNVLDLNNSDLIACTVCYKDNSKQRRFLVIDSQQLILVEPDSKRLGWGVAKFVGFLQDIEVAGDKDDSRFLHMTVHRGGASHNRAPLLAARFQFDDHIRCMAAKQRLTKGRSKARQKKMHQIAHLLEMPGQTVLDSPAFQGSSKWTTGSSSSRSKSDQRSAMFVNNRVPGFAAALRRENVPSAGISRIQIAQNRSVEGIRNEGQGRSRRRKTSNSSTNSSGSNTEAPSTNSRTRSTPRSRDNSPRMPRPRSEEIPMEDFQHSRSNSPTITVTPNKVPSRSATPSRLVFEPNCSRETSNSVVVQPVIVSPSSEETSFMESERNNSIQTV